MLLEIERGHGEAEVEVELRLKDDAVGESEVLPGQKLYHVISPLGPEKHET